MKEQFHGGDLASYSFPHHIHSIIWLRRVLILKVMVHFLQPFPHSCPLLVTYASQQIDDKILLESIRGFDEETKLREVKIIFIWQFDIVTDDNRDTVACNCIKQTVGRRCVSSQMEAELGPLHAHRRTSYSSTATRSCFKMYASFILQQLIQLLPDNASLQIANENRVKKSLSMHYSGVGP